MIAQGGVMQKPPEGGRRWQMELQSLVVSIVQMLRILQLLFFKEARLIA